MPAKHGPLKKHRRWTTMALWTALPAEKESPAIGKCSHHLPHSPRSPFSSRDIDAPCGHSSPRNSPSTLSDNRPPPKPHIPRRRQSCSRPRHSECRPAGSHCGSAAGHSRAERSQNGPGRPCEVRHAKVGRLRRRKNTEPTTTLSGPTDPDRRNQHMQVRRHLPRPHETHGHRAATRLARRTSTASPANITQTDAERRCSVRDRVVPHPAPRIASAQTPDSERCTLEGAMPL